MTDAERSMLPGEHVGRYRIESLLGQGGMGVVYRAFDDELERPVALKVLRSGWAGNSASADKARERLVREAQAMAQLSDPHVVQIYDVGEHHGELFIAMELVEGTTLREWLARLGPPAERPEQWPQIVAMFIQAARGLAAAHAVDLVHRDFKPANVLVDREGQARVADFGLVRVLSRSDDGDHRTTQRTSPLSSTQTDSDPDHADALRTKTGAILGTLAYCSPQQLRGEPVDARGDQFSLCVALYEALFGERPFHGDNLMQLQASLTMGARREPLEDVAIPRWLVAVVERGLAFHPERRWSTMDDLIAALLDDPTRRRRRWLTTGALGLLGLGLAGSYVGSKAIERARCEAAGNSIDEVWSEDQRVSLKEVFIATNATDATDAATRVSVQFDAWSERWAQARTAACFDVSISGDLAERRAGCLKRQRWHLEALVDVLTAADRTTVLAASSAVQQLPPIERCEDPVWLQTEPQGLASDDETRVELDGMRRDLAQASALDHLGRNEQAIALAEEVLGRARQRDDVALQAEALALLGRTHYQIAADEQAESALVEAYFSAVDIAHSRLAATVALDLVFVVGVRLGRSADGRQWLEHARTNLSRAGLDLEQDEPLLFVMLGELKAAEGHYPEAIAAHERGLELRRAALGPSHPEVIDSLLNIGQGYAAQGDHAKALETLEWGRALAELSLGASHRTLADLDDAMGQVLDSAGRSAEAIESYRRAIEIREHALGRDNPAVGASLNNLGTALYYRGDREEAVDVLGRALEIRQHHTQANDPDTIATAANLAFMHCELGHFDRASQLFTVLDQEGLDTTSPATAKLLYGYGDCLERSGQYERARTRFEVALEIDEHAFGPEHHEVAADLHRLGRVLLRTGELDRALKVQRRAVAIRAAVLDPNSRKMAASLDAVGQILLALGQAEPAIAEHRKALALRLTAKGPQHWTTATTRTKLGQALAASGDHEQAREHFEQAITVLERSDIDKPRRLAEALEASASGLALRPAEALARLERAIQLRERSPDYPDKLAETKNQLARLRASTGR